MKIRITTTLEVTEEQLRLLKEEALECGQADSGTDKAIVIEHVIDEIHTFVAYVHERREGLNDDD